MTDQELDILLRESAKRQPDIAQINATVMRTVRRDLRLKTLRKWAKLLGICFGLPVAVVLRVLSIALPIATILILAAQRLHYFSPEV